MRKRYFKYTKEEPDAEQRRLASDKAWAREHWEDLQGGCGDTECSWPDCDCTATVMLSTGYAEVFRNGEVVSGGRVIFNVEEEV